MPTEQPWVMAVQADTADANDREGLARSVRERIAAHSDWILLNTCHRVELYGFGTPPDLDARLKVQTGESAVRHLIRVATGLESAIVGEDEVLHQVREAIGNARAGRTLDGRLVRLFESAIAAGRRIGALPIGEHTWVALVVRGGRTEQPRGSLRLEPGDEVVLLSDPVDEQALRHVFTRPREARAPKRE
jgi:hypothetical protein